ncbi:hypothetical protein V8C37DRAFT_370327 [Trichoderma ceciliae]
MGPFFIYIGLFYVLLLGSWLVGLVERELKMSLKVQRNFHRPLVLWVAYDGGGKRKQGFQTVSRISCMCAFRILIYSCCN